MAAPLLKLSVKAQPHPRWPPLLTKNAYIANICFFKLERAEICILTCWIEKQTKDYMILGKTVAKEFTTDKMYFKISK